jgi:hypothetical protein
MRFKPRIERALSAFMARLTPAMLARIGHIEPVRTNPWPKLIAKLLWERLAPENGVALPESLVFGIAQWPIRRAPMKLREGEKFWVEHELANNDLILFRVLSEGGNGPRERAKLYSKATHTIVLVADTDAPSSYPYFANFEYSGLGSWVSCLLAIHLYGERLRDKGENGVYAGVTTIDAEVARKMIYQIRNDLENRQTGRPPVFFTAPSASLPLPHKSLSELVEGLIGWEIAALAAASIRGGIEIKDAKKGDFVAVSYAGETVTGKVVQVKDGKVTVDLTGKHPDEGVGLVDFSTRQPTEAFDGYVARGWPAPKGPAEQAVRSNLIARAGKPSQLTKYRLEEAFDDDARLWRSSITYLRRLEPEIGKAAVGKLLEHVQSCLREL